MSIAVHTLIYVVAHKNVGFTTCKYALTKSIVFTCYEAHENADPDPITCKYALSMHKMHCLYTFSDKKYQDLCDFN